jgi:hypothetical protein
MTGPSVDDALRDLREALVVEPSAGFADGVRRRVNVDGMQASGWIKCVGGVAAAAAIALAVVLPGDDRAEITPNASAVVQRHGAMPKGAALQSPHRPSAAVDRGEVSTQPISRRPATPPREGEPARVEPTMFVLTSQPERLRSLWRSVEDVDLPAPMIPSESAVVASVAIVPLEIEPLVLASPPRSDDGQSRGPIPVIRRAFDSASRSLR